MGPNALGKLARRRIDTKLTGEKQRVAQLDARRVRADGGRSIRGSNSLFVHTGLHSRKGFYLEAPDYGSGLWPTSRMLSIAPRPCKLFYR
ncbi:Uncharacterised protein [Collinsella aerofaciens]|nr:Uncharacterised protein [Collinsella aerofaciens]